MGRRHVTPVGDPGGAVAVAVAVAVAAVLKHHGDAQEGPRPLPQPHLGRPQAQLSNNLVEAVVPVGGIENRVWRRQGDGRRVEVVAAVVRSGTRRGMML